MIDKKSLRLKMQEKRKELSISQVYKKSSIIQKKIEDNHFFKISNKILIYVSYDHEVHTHNLIKKSLHTEKKIFVPRSRKRTYTIDPILINEWNDLSPGLYSILEPKKHKKILSNNIDLIIIPGLGFDLYGNRIGYGKGFFDRLINRIPQAILIGLAFDFQITRRIPTELHDKKMDIIITEKRVIYCTNKSESK
jgi:5-formyltetrahydrofolate cyclo-ligase